MRNAVTSVIQVNTGSRIIVMPGEHLVAKGPYRWLRHPNYVIVALEVAELADRAGVVRKGVVREDAAWSDVGTHRGGDRLSQPRRR